MAQSKRPINVGFSDLLQFRWPITALTSISHRVAGVVLFVAVGFMLFALEQSWLHKMRLTGSRGL